MDSVLVALTLAAYLVGAAVARRVGRPWANATLIGVALVVAALLLARVPYDRYREGTAALTWLLGPAVVALAVPLHRERALLRRFARPVLLGALVGALVSVALGLAAGRLLHLAPAWTLALAGRSATSPINIALARDLGGDASLAAVVSILTGIVGATLGPGWLTRLGVRSPLARGLALGVNAHGIGTARALAESRAAGAAAGVGMGLGGLVVALVLPLVWGALGRGP